MKRRAEFEIERATQRRTADPGVAERRQPREILISAVIDRRSALLKDRRQQQQRQTLGDANEQSRIADAKAGGALDDFAHRIDSRRTRPDLDIEPGIAIEILPQSRVVPGELERRLARQLHTSGA